MPRELSHLHVLAFCFIDHAVLLDERLRPHGMRAFATLGYPKPTC